MSGMSLQTIKSKQNSWWMKMHLVFSLLIVSQVYSFHHKIEHLANSSEMVCDQCIVASDYFESFSNENNLNAIEYNTVYAFNLDLSVTQAIPNYYSSRAPPFLS